MSSIGVVVVPLPWRIFIFKFTSVPLTSPFDSNFCKELNLTVTRTAFTFELVICLDTEVAFSTFTFTFVSVSIFAIPEIKDWPLVPNRGSNSTFWKLKSVAWRFVTSAFALNTGVFPK